MTPTETQTEFLPSPKTVVLTTSTALMPVAPTAPLCLVELQEGEEYVMARPGGEEILHAYPGYLVVSAAATLEERMAAARQLGTLKKHINWWIGDFLVDCHVKLGELSAQVAAYLDLSADYVTRIHSVTRRFPPHKRNSKVPFSIHKELCSLSDEDAKTWLDTCEANQWTKEAFRDAYRQYRALAEPTLPGLEPPMPPHPAYTEVVRDAEKSGLSPEDMQAGVDAVKEVKREQASGASAAIAATVVSDDTDLVERVKEKLGEDAGRLSLPMTDAAKHALITRCRAEDITPAEVLAEFAAGRRPRLTPDAYQAWEHLFHANNQRLESAGDDPLAFDDFVSQIGMWLYEREQARKAAA